MIHYRWEKKVEDTEERLVVQGYRYKKRIPKKTNYNKHKRQIRKIVHQKIKFVKMFIIIIQGSRRGYKAK